jgi:hypothetical protein
MLEHVPHLILRTYGQMAASCGAFCSEVSRIRREEHASRVARDDLPPRSEGRISRAHLSSLVSMVASDGPRRKSSLPRRLRNMA